MESAEAAVNSGAEFLGFIFVPSSRRYIKPEDAKPIIELVRKSIKIVGVFKNQTLEEVNKISSLLGLDYVQLHGQESAEYCSQINTKVIKAFALDSNFDVAETKDKMSKYSVDYFLLDRKKQGEGEMLDLQTVKALASEFPVILAGGLNPDNVVEIIRIVKPQIVDVASGVETDGIQDLEKIKSFIKNAKEVNL